MKIPFNKPYLTGKEAHYMYQAVFSGHISGNGLFTKKCHKFFEEQYGFRKALLTTSCTDALEMAALLANIKPDDEVIVPSYTFVSTALAFVRQGGKIVFVDSREDHPGIDEKAIEEVITPKTRAIVPVHYAGVACDMEIIMNLSEKYNLIIIEDAAHGIDSYYKGKPLGSFGSFGSLSFHETKNIISGEGGMLLINNESFIERAEIIWEKGTNRAAFFKGEVDKYSWVDIGSSFLPSDIIAAFLYAQLENIENIQRKRLWNWNKYYEGLKALENRGLIRLPYLPEYASNNGHMFYLICNTAGDRNRLIKYLKEQDILVVFHYQSLHKSPYYINFHDGRTLKWADFYSDNLVRLPMYYEISEEQIDFIVEKINKFFLLNH